MKVMIDINKKWLEKHAKEFSDNYDNQDYNEDKGTCYKIDLELVNNEYLVSNDDKIQVSAGDENLYISCEEKPTINDLLNLATIISKYYNKAKSAIESLK